MAELKESGYEYREYRLGDTVKFEDEEENYKIVGFDENEEEIFLAIGLINKDSLKNKIEISKSNNVTHHSNEKVMKYRWASPKQIEVLKKWNEVKEKYQIQIIETLQTTVEVEATYKEEAIEKVKEMYAKEEIILDCNDFSHVNFK